MNTIMLTIHTVRNVSTVQIKCGKHYVVENSGWNNEAKFPLKALLRGVYKIAKLTVKESYFNYKTKLITKIVEMQCQK